jgi:hypothetical protein
MCRHVAIFVSSSIPPSNSVSCHGIAYSACMFFDAFLRYFSTAQLLACVDNWPSSSVHHYHHLIRSHATELPTLPACFLTRFCHTFQQLISLHVWTCSHLSQFIITTVQFGLMPRNCLPCLHVFYCVFVTPFDRSAPCMCGHVAIFLSSSLPPSN